MGTTTVSQYQMFWDLRMQLETNGWSGKVRTVNELQAQAIAYVWGWQDAKGKEFRDSDASWNFGNAYGILAAEFELGIRCSRAPIQDAFAKWLKSGRVDDPWDYHR